MSNRYSFSIPRWLPSLLAIVALVGAVNRSAKADSWSEANSSLQALETYLKRHPTGQGWRDYLQLAALNAELKKGGQADRQVINATLDLLNSGAAGSDLPKFVALRKALYNTLLTNRADLAAAFSAAKGSFRATSDAEVQAARKNLELKLAALRSYLKTHPTTGSGWTNYLLLDDLTAELAKADKVDAEALKYDYLPLYTDGYPGLEIKQIAETGKAIGKYADLLAAKQNPQASIEHATRMGKLAEVAEKMAKGSGNIDTNELGELLSKTIAAQQSPELVTAARRLYSEPNVLFLAKRKIIAAAMENHVDETAPLTDTILGTAIRGTSHTRGDLLLNLRNNPNRAEFEMNLLGQVASNTAGFNGPAVVYSRGQTAINGRKLLWLDDQGMHTSNNATAAAKTNTTFTGFGATRGLFKGMIANVASQRAQQSKGTAEMIAASHASDRVKNRLDSQAPTMVANANRDMRKNIRAPLERWGVFPEDVRFSSTTEAIHGTALAASPSQLGAPYPHPKVEFQGNHDIELRIHESALNNAAFTAFARRMITRDYVEEWFKRNKLKVPEELQDEEQRDWYIVLDEKRPLYITFQDGGFDVEIRGTSWKSGDKTFEVPMVVAAAYKFETTPNGVKAVRQGELKIAPPGHEAGKQLDNDQTILKKLLVRRFDKILKPEIVGEGIQLKGRLANYGKLFVRAFNSDSGWLQATLGK